MTAHNGTTSQEFTVVKERPATIDKGFNTQSLEQLFNIDPVSNWGMPNYKTAIGPSLGVVGGSLVICAGDGTTPIYVNKVTGSKEGTINLGNATPGLITNDEGGHLLIVNKAGGHETVNIYRTSSVNDAPVLLHSVANPLSLPVGRIKCIGNIDTEALITLTCGGVAGVTSSSDIVTMRVIDGAVTEVKTVNFAATGISWGNAPVNINTVVPASLAANNGWFESHYEPSKLHWMFEDGSVPVAIGSDTSGWGLNPNSLDSKMFNNVNYLALFVESHFPTGAWARSSTSTTSTIPRPSVPALMLPARPTSSSPTTPPGSSRATQAQPPATSLSLPRPTAIPSISTTTATTQAW